MRLFRSIRRELGRAFSPPHVKRHRAFSRKWTAENGEARRYDFPYLVKGATVVDLGAYRGEWALGIADRYNVHVHAFEAHPNFAAELSRIVAENGRITTHPVALSSMDGTFAITDDGVASRATSQGQIVCRCVEARKYLALSGIETIDLLKVNIEGGEYDILPHLIATGLINDVGTIQVQFHRYSETDEAKRDEIISGLSKTHDRTWCYDFVWEEWVPKAGRRGSEP